MLYFPHPLVCGDEGILAVGGDLSVDRLLLAYRFGIFPWYNDPPIMWWYTHPRCVLYPSKIKIAKSMRPYFNQKKFTATVDKCFTEVMEECALVERIDQEHTWISSELIESFTILHEKGYAHSIEVWEEDELVGGLYGIAIGKIFFGESMFTKASNGSKFALISLCSLLERRGFELIDCQQETGHLMSMGAELMSKESFYQRLKLNLLSPDDNGGWSLDNL